MLHIEENTQKVCVEWFMYQYPNYWPLLHHSPNGGRRTAREGARFKAMGTKAGFPDLGLFVPKGGYHGLFLEMKTDKGTLTQSQKAMRENLTAQGYRYEVCRGFDDFRNAVEEYLK